MDKWTAFNITANRTKMLFAGVMTLFALPIAILMMVCRFIYKSDSWKDMIDEKKPLKEIELSRYCVEVTCLPTYFGVAELEKIIRETMDSLYGDKFLDVHVIGDYNKAFEKCNTLLDLNEQLFELESELKLTGKRKESSRSWYFYLFCCCCSCCQRCRTTEFQDDKLR